MKIKRKVEMNEKELIKYLVDHESTTIRFSGISYDGAWLSIEPEIESKVHFEFKDASTFEKTFTVEVEEELTEDTVIPKLLTTFETINVKNKVRYQRVRIDENYTIKLMLNITEVHREPVETLHIVNDDGTHTLIWRDGKLVE